MAAAQNSWKFFKHKQQYSGLWLSAHEDQLRKHDGESRPKSSALPAKRPKSSYFSIFFLRSKDIQYSNYLPLATINHLPLFSEWLSNSPKKPRYTHPSPSFFTSLLRLKHDMSRPQLLTTLCNRSASPASSIFPASRFTSMFPLTFVPAKRYTLFLDATIPDQTQYPAYDVWKEHSD